MKRTFIQLLEQLRGGVKVVLATVIRTSGSTPQKPGSSAIYGESGLLSGTVGGGALEEEVGHIADSVLISGSSDHYYFNLDSEPGEEGAICGGEVVVLVDAEPVKHLKALEAMERSLLNRRDGWMLTVITRGKGNGKTLTRYWIPDKDSTTLPADLEPAVMELVRSMDEGAAKISFSELEIPSDDRALYEIAFLERIKPLPRLVIAGAGHIGKALAHLGSLLDFEITVIDDREEYASREQVPDADHLIVKDFGEAMTEIGNGTDTYVVIATRGHNHDAEALKSCIGSDAAYVGMVGSTNKVRIMKEQFLAEGWATPEQWSRIHTPVGLPIGSKSVQEIAISIAAELIQARHQKKKPTDNR